MSSLARRDLSLVICISSAVAVTFMCIHSSEAPAASTCAPERFQSGEFPGVMLGISILLIWYSLRRYCEAAREPGLRPVLKHDLAEIWAENQRLARKNALQLTLIAQHFGRMASF